MAYAFAMPESAAQSSKTCSMPNGVLSRRCSLPAQRRQYTAFDREMSMAIHTGVPSGGRFGVGKPSCRLPSTTPIFFMGASLLAAALTAAVYG